MELVAVIATLVTPSPMVMVGELLIDSLKVAVIVTADEPLITLSPSLLESPLIVGAVVSIVKVKLSVPE